MRDNDALADISFARSCPKVGPRKFSRSDGIAPHPAAHPLRQPAAQPRCRPHLPRVSSLLQVRVHAFEHKEFTSVCKICKLQKFDTIKEIKESSVAPYARWRWKMFQHHDVKSTRIHILFMQPLRRSPIRRSKREASGQPCPLEEG